MPSFFLALIAIILSGAIGFLFRSKKLAGKSFFKDLIVVGAAAMIGVSLIHIFPEVSEMSPASPFIFVGGFLLIYLLENAFMVHACVEHDCHFHQTSWLSWIAILIHTIFDGIAISAGFSSNNLLGWSILCGVVIHQIPVSVSLVSLLAHSNFSKAKQDLLLTLFVLAAPIGFVGGRFLFPQIPETIVAWILAFSGGSLLYLGASDILPNVHKKTQNHQLVAGLFLMTLLLVAGAKFFE